jgi:hypothetical protein
MMSCVRSLVLVIQHGNCFGMLAGVAEQRKHRQRIVRVLLGHHRKIDGLAVEARRRSGLQATGRQLQFAQTRGQRNRRHVAHATAGRIRQTDVNLAVEEGSGGQHHGARGKAHAQLRHRTDHPIAFDDQIVAGLGEQRQIRLIFQSAADGLRYSTRSACARVARTAGPLLELRMRNWMPASSVAAAIAPSERIDFLDQMPLADAADRRIAAHRARACRGCA